MTKYFSIPRIVEACERLREFDSKWVLVPFVMACNGVQAQGDYVILHEREGTDLLFRQFFDGDLVGLPPKTPGIAHHIRPAFKDLSRGLAKRAGGKFASDLVVHGSRYIWGNMYTQLVAKAPAAYALLRRPNENDGWKLAPDFGALFSEKLEGFHFEDFLVWLHAFSGFSDEVNSWASLLKKFREAHRSTSRALPRSSPPNVSPRRYQ